MSVLRLHQLSKSFNSGTAYQRQALKALDLELAPGDFCCIIGGNGAGKTTILNAIAGTLRPDSGRVAVAGVDVTDWPVHKRARFIARVFQDPMQGTAAEMTVAENLLLARLRSQPARFKPALSKERRQYFQDQLARLNLGLENRLESRVALLSGGQRQALSLLMAVMGGPALLLLDEHTAALDPRTAALVLALTRQVVAEQRLTTLMVTHDMEMAINCGNRLIMMDEGTIVYSAQNEEKTTLTVEQLVTRFHHRDDKILLR
jgi:putative tryptophan/tyrosine transport system ATP-binding protein